METAKPFYHSPATVTRPVKTVNTVPRQNRAPAWRSGVAASRFLQPLKGISSARGGLYINYRIRSFY